MFRRSAGPSSSSTTHTTSRQDWEQAVVDLYARVVDGVPFGIAVVAKEKTLLGHTLRYRLNPRFPHQAVGDYIRRRFNSGAFDRLFQSDEGLEPAPVKGLYKVTGDKVGLPRNCLVGRIEGTGHPQHQAVVVFGGERLEGQLERRLQVMGEVLAGTGGGVGRGESAVLDTHEKLLGALSNVNVKRLYDYDLDLLSRIVNGLEEGKEDLPKELKPKFKSVSDYILKRRLKR